MQQPPPTSASSHRVTARLSGWSRTTAAGVWPNNCGISQDDLVRYNGGNTRFCSSLQPGQYVCCSSGSLPKPPDTLAPATADGTCKYVQAASNEGCWDLANKCGGGETVDDIVRANGGNASFCNIQKNQYACCGHGKLPDFSPKPNKDGTCFTYTVVAVDKCADIAAANQLSDYKLIEQYNKNTWGWAGCSNLQIGMAICLSTGKAPMPNQMADAQCGVSENWPPGGGGGGGEKRESRTASG